MIKRLVSKFSFRNTEYYDTRGRKVGCTQITFEADLGTKNVFYIRELMDPKTMIWEPARKC